MQQLHIIILFIAYVSCTDVLCDAELFGATNHARNITAYESQSLECADPITYSGIQSIEQYIQTLPPIRTVSVGVADMWDAVYYSAEEILYSATLDVAMWRRSCHDICPTNGRPSGAVDTRYATETVILLGPVKWQSGLFHFIVDGLILAAILPANILNTARVAIQGSNAAHQYTNVLFPQLPVILLDPAVNYRFKRAYLPSGNTCGWSTALHYTAIHTLTPKCHFNGSRYVLFSGRRGLGRHMPNWDDIISAYKQAYPSHTIREHLGTEPAADAFCLFRHAHTVIGLHGAGLTHLIACQQGTFVIEITPYPYAPRMAVQRCYADMACKLGLIYTFIPVPGDHGGYRTRLNIREFLHRVAAVYAYTTSFSHSHGRPHRRASPQTSRNNPARP